MEVYNFTRSVTLLAKQKGQNKTQDYKWKINVYTEGEIGGKVENDVDGAQCAVCEVNQMFVCFNNSIHCYIGSNILQIRN